MKAIVCEMCSSKDVVKDGDYYVCQNCGTKYTPESARKLMVEVEGKVDVSGSTVKVDTTDSVKRALENARRAKKKEDWEEAEKYYDLVERDEPSNIEAIFYSAYAKAKTTLVSDDLYRRQAVFKSFGNSISIVDDNFDVEKEAELRPLVDQMVADIILMSGSSFVYTITKNGEGKVTGNNAGETYYLFGLMEQELAESLVNIAKKLQDVQNDTAANHYYVCAKTLLCSINANHMKSSEWKDVRRKKLIGIAEVQTGINKQSALDTYKAVLADYQADNEYPALWDTKYKAPFENVLSRIEKLDPSFDTESERGMKREALAQAVKKEQKKRAGCIVLGIILIAVCIAIGVIIAIS